MLQHFQRCGEIDWVVPSLGVVKNCLPAVQMHRRACVVDKNDLQVNLIFGPLTASQ